MTNNPEQPNQIDHVRQQFLAVLNNKKKKNAKKADSESKVHVIKNLPNSRNDFRHRSR